MSLADDLRAAKARFHDYRCGLEAAAIGTLRDAPNGLDALVLLRKSLPERFATFRDFETSRFYSRKAAYQTFDRAIAAAEQSEAAS